MVPGSLVLLTRSRGSPPESEGARVPCRLAILSRSTRFQLVHGFNCILRLHEPLTQPGADVVHRRHNDGDGEHLYRGILDS